MDGERNPASLNVAYVDDEAASRALARRVLQDHGYVPLLGGSGDDAVSLRFGAPEPAAMFVNGSMPGSNGPDAIAEIRRREAAEGLPRMPIALETGWGFPGSDWPEGCDADAYMADPWGTAELLAILERLLAERTSPKEAVGKRR